MSGRRSRTPDCAFNEHGAYRSPTGPATVRGDDSCKLLIARSQAVGAEEVVIVGDPRAATRNGGPTSDEVMNSRGPWDEPGSAPVTETVGAIPHRETWASMRVVERDGLQRRGRAKRVAPPAASPGSAASSRCASKPRQLAPAPRKRRAGGQLPGGGVRWFTGSSGRVRVWPRRGCRPSIL